MSEKCGDATEEEETSETDLSDEVIAFQLPKDWKTNQTHDY